MLKHVISGGIHLDGLAPGQHSTEKLLQQWRAISDIVSNLTGQGIELHTYLTDSDVLIN